MFEKEAEEWAKETMDCVKTENCLNQDCNYFSKEVLLSLLLKTVQSSATTRLMNGITYRSPGRPSRLKPEEKRPGKRKAAARKKKGPLYCWRVSVWNDELMGYVVVKCGMTKKQADEFAAGKNAVKRPCWM